MQYGTAAPKFRTQGGNFILLDFSRVLEDSPIFDAIEQPSVVNGYINNIHNGVHWVYTVRVHVFKESESIAKSNELLPFLGSEVYLYRHREAYPFQDKNGNDVLFRIQEVIPDHYDTPDYKDIIDIKFKSTNYIDIKQSLLPEDVIIDSKGMVIVDSDGKFQQG